MNLYSEMKDIQLIPLLLLYVIMDTLSMDLTQVLVWIQETGINKLPPVNRVIKRINFLTSVQKGFSANFNTPDTTYVI